MASQPPYSKTTDGKKLMTTSITAQKRPTIVELPRRDLFKRERTSSGSTTSDVAPCPKLSIS